MFDIKLFRVLLKIDPLLVFRKLSALFIMMMSFIMISACATYHVQETPLFDTDKQWALIPLQNFSQTPQASEKVSSVLFSILKTKGFENLVLAEFNQENHPILGKIPKKSPEESMQWAKDRQVDYMFTGSVEEWRYKSGLNGEPAVSITLQIIDVHSDDVIWTATGARTGWGRESASMTTRRVIDHLLKKVSMPEKSHRSLEEKTASS